MKPVSDIMERIHAAADRLFEQNGRVAYPTVDAVRKAARVNMNDASSGMREWRRKQMAGMVPAPVQVPGAIQEAQAALAGQVWQVAQVVAGESLAAAQAAWAAERSQLESLNKEMADAFEAQALEMEALQTEARLASERADSVTAACTGLNAELSDLRVRLATAESDCQREAARTVEVALRASDLRQELDHAHEELAAAHAAARDALRAHTGELSAVRADARLAESILRDELDVARQQQRELMQFVSLATAAAGSGAVRPNEKDGG